MLHSRVSRVWIDHIFWTHPSTSTSSAHPSTPTSSAPTTLPTTHGMAISLLIGANHILGHSEREDRPNTSKERRTHPSLECELLWWESIKYFGFLQFVFESDAWWWPLQPFTVTIRRPQPGLSLVFIHDCRPTNTMETLSALLPSFFFSATSVLK
jgi:hypothetical protein